MKARAESRVELRAPAARKARWQRAAERAGISLSDWARRRLDAVAEQELAQVDLAPTPDGVAEAVAAYGAMGPERAERLRARVADARRTPWRGRS